MPNWESDARFVVAAFRADTARAGMAGNVKALSPEFEAMWRDNDSHHAVITKAWTIADGRVSQAMWHRRDFHASPSVRTLEFG
jgi:hypothetical protein